MLTKLKAAAAALVLGVITAGAIVSAQPPGGVSAEPSKSARKAPRLPQSVASRGGNMIVDWIPADGRGGLAKAIAGIETIPADTSTQFEEASELRRVD